MLSLAPVEPGGRLVEEQEAVGAGQRPSQLDESALAGRQAPCHVVGEVAYAAPGDRFVRPGADLVAL